MFGYGSPIRRKVTMTVMVKFGHVGRHDEILTILKSIGADDVEDTAGTNFKVTSSVWTGLKLVGAVRRLHKLSCVDSVEMPGYDPDLEEIMD